MTFFLDVSDEANIGLENSRKKIRNLLNVF